MSKQIKTYVPSALVVAISHAATNTSYVLSGFSKDSVISIEYPDAAWTEKTLTDGSLVREHSKDNNIRMTLHIDQTSQDNDFLAALAKFDEEDITGLDGIFTATFANKAGREWAYSSQCFVKRPQSYEYGASTSTRDYVIVMANADQYMGGSGKLDQDLVNTLTAFGIDVEDRWKL